jgi:hypothetical protein
MANQAVHDVTQGKPSDQKLARLQAEDEQFSAAYPLKEVVAAKRQPGMRIAQILQAVMEGYADRPALGQRARELVTDSVTGRATLRLLPRFDTITYGELWARARAVAGEWHTHGGHPFHTGDFVCTLGFTSPEYASLLLSVVHLGGVVVPLQTSAPTSQHGAIIAETEPRIVATGIEYIEAAVSAVLAGYQPQRLVVFDHDSRDDDRRDALEAARMRLADAGSDIIVDTLDELVQRGKNLPEPPLFVADAITAIGADRSEGFQSYNLAGGHEVGASLDSIVDWLVAAGCPMERLEPYDEWLSYFETAMHALTEEQKQESMLAILGPYRRPQAAGTRVVMPAEKFQSGCREAGIAIPQLTQSLIQQYVAGLRHHRLIADSRPREFAQRRYELRSHAG